MWYLLALALFLIPFTILPEQAYAQTMQINGTTPCFLNYTAGPNMWENCGFGDDYLTFALAPWEWITGGNFSLVLISLLILATYLKYHKAVYPILIGVMFLPIAYFVFPAVFISWAAIMTILATGLILAYIFLKQTKEY